MKKVLKWTGVVILTPFLLIVFLAVLLYIPPIQNWAVQKVAAYASEETGMEITVGHVHLAFPLDLSIEEAKAIEYGEKRDTVLDVRQVIVDVQLLPLFGGQVEVDALEFHQLKLNTTHFIPDVRVKGFIDLLSVESHGIDLGGETVRVQKATLADATVDVALSDTVPPDTTESENFWKIAVDNLDIQRTDVTVHMPGDTLRLGVYMGKTSATDGSFDLGKGHYQLTKLDWTDGQFEYQTLSTLPDKEKKPSVEGMDFNHILLSNITLGIDSLDYCDPKLSVSLRACSFRERCGLQVDRLTGHIAMDSVALHLPDLELRTPESSLSAAVDMDLNAFDEQHPGKMNIAVHGAFGKQDLLHFLADMPAEFRRQWPNYPLTVDGVVKGNMQKMHIAGLNIKLPTAFSITADGFAGNLTDTDHLYANIDVHAKTHDMRFATTVLDADTRKMFRIPNGISFDGKIRADGPEYSSDFILREGGGMLKGHAMFDAGSMRYNANLRAQALQLQHFLPDYGLHPFTGTIDLTGNGTDPLSTRTGLHAKLNIEKFQFGDYNLDQISADATMRNGVTCVRIDSQNELVKGLVSLDALTNGKLMKATLSCDLSKADLYGLKLVDEQLMLALCAHLDLETDLNQYYKVQGLVSDIVVKEERKFYRPNDIVIDALTRRDTIIAVLDCGDFHLNMHAQGGYEKLMAVGEKLMDEVNRQYADRTIDQLRLREQFPVAAISLSSGRDNFIVRMMQRYGYELGSLSLNMVTSPLSGINGRLHIDSLVVDSILIDTVNFAVRSDSTRISYQAQVRNNKRNPQYTFNALFDGIIYDEGTILGTRLYDDHDELGVRLGLKASMENDGYMLRVYGPDPTLGYKVFHVNKDNYVFLGKGQRISADLRLRADDGQGVQVYSDDADSTALQDITFSLNKFDLEKVLSVVPYTPEVSGMMDGDFHIVQTANDLSVSSNLSVNNLIYEKSPLGNLSSEFVYMPKSDGSHYVDGILNHNGHDVATIVGTYQSEGKGLLDVDLGLARTPLSLLNAFLPAQLLGLYGYGDGTLSVRGPLSKPVVNGEVLLDSAYLQSPAYGVKLRFDNAPVTINGSHLLFENFNMYANNNQPLTITGQFDFSDFDHMNVNMRMRARNFLIIDAKENRYSEAYGKAYVNFLGMMTGEVDNLSMRGRVDVLGATDMTYILRDSPLSADNQLDELVKFTDFSDTTTAQVVNHPAVSGISMDMTMSIDESARIMCALNADKSNYVDLIGGGDLRMQYNATDNLRMTGRYTLSNGEMKYSLPIIPLKTFTIQDGSYIEFTGDMMNPRLNITATEETKANVSSEDGQARSVTFNCGVVITQTLNDMGLEFIIEAPQDMTISNELNTMSKEERGKVAVTMLTTGMYLTDGNTSGFSMNNALSAFLNSQINGIAGNALRTLDLSFGMDNTTDANGNTYTDYSFKFAKRFWDNRLRVIVGGKVSSGSENPNRDDSFFDNVQFEYRLNQGASQFLKLFYKRDSYDWLEGQVGEYGAGFIWRRKLSHFQDLFRFKDKKTQNMPVMQGSGRTRSRQQGQEIRERQGVEAGQVIRETSDKLPVPKDSTVVKE